MMRHGARPAGLAPAATALRRINGNTELAAGEAVEVERKVQRDGTS
ncbi:hypothetical protein [Actinomadura sp. CNU-125]|nr:hypothetical protein [Actinomadura sp. CNU-125]